MFAIVGLIIVGIMIVLSCYDTYKKIHYASSAVYGISKVNNLQKELTDFANKQREFYKKTH